MIHLCSYQDCIEEANNDMSTKIILQSRVEDIIDVLCEGMDKVSLNFRAKIDKQLSNN